MSGRPAIWEAHIPEIVTLYEDEELTRGEIARRLGTSVQTVSRMLRKAGVTIDNSRVGTRPSGPLSVEHRRKIAESRKGKGTGVRSPSKQPRVCDGCGEMYQPSTAKQRFCSRSCRNIGRAVEERKLAQEAWRQHPDLCPCGTPIDFEHRHTRSYCSSECRTKFAPRRKADPENYVELMCETCDKPFSRRKSFPGAHRFCSNECAAKWTRKVRHIGVKDADVVLDSGWEALVWGWATYLKIPISRVNRSLAVPFEDGWYAPDFLIDGHWVEVKGLDKEDGQARRDAWKAVHGPVVVFDREKLNSLIGTQDRSILSV